MGLEALFDPAFAASVPRFVAPILLAALGGALCERAGVFNIALEGFILVGAFAAVMGAFFLGSAWAGLACAMLGGVVMGLIFAEFHLRRPGDPIVVSIALNLLAAGITVYLLRTLLGVTGAFRDPAIPRLPDLHLPGIESMPLLGDVLSGQSVLFYAAIGLALGLHVMFRRHRLGLRLRAAGENPAALAAGGVSPARTRLIALVACGALCGMAGAQLAISNVTLFVEGMSAGRGWIAVVAVLLTRGRPLPLLAIVALFGFVDSLSFRVQGLGWPQQFTDMLPYVVTLAVLVALSWWRLRQRSG